MEELSKIGKEIKEQDNMATANPIFILFDIKNYPAEDGYGDKYIYVDVDNDAYEIPYSKEGLLEYCEDCHWLTEEMMTLGHEDLYEEAKKHYTIEIFDVHEIREFKQAFFTRKSAEQYLDANRHHFKKPLIWCDSLWRNDEMQSIRNALIEGRLK